MGEISLQSNKTIPINAQCAVFGESEVVSLIHQKVPKADIARAVHDAIAGRIGSLARIVGLEEDIVIIGGVANNIGIIDSLEKSLGTGVIAAENPEFVGAYGAALAAKAGIVGEEI